MTDVQGLIKAVEAKQRELKETDLQFAQRLGVSRQAWQLARTGGMNPGRRTLQGIAQAFPEFLPDVMAFLMGRNASIVTTDDSRLKKVSR